MPIIETRGALSSRGYGQFAQGAAAPTAGAFIEDVFSTTLYTGTGAAQSIPNGIQLGTGATSNGFISALNNNTNVSNLSFSSVAVDSSSNVYAVGFYFVSTTQRPLIAKFSSLGVFQWAYGLSQSGNYNGVACDSSGNVYAVGTDTTTQSAIIVKYDSSGSILWQRTTVAGGNEIFRAVAVGSDGSVVACGGADPSLGPVIIFRYNSSGTLQWQRRVSGNLSGSGAYGVAIDSSNDIYVTMQLRKTDGDTDWDEANTYRINSSGTQIWARQLSLGTISFSARGISVDSSGNAYVVCLASGQSFVVRYNNSDGAVPWRKQIGPVTSSHGISVDSTGNVYVLSAATVTGSGDNWAISKLSAVSGDSVWNRSFGGSGTDTPGGIFATASGNFFCAGGIRTSFGATLDNAFVTSFPADGSGASAYTVGGAPVSYLPTTLTVANGSGNDSPAENISTSSLTEQASTFTSSLVSLAPFSTPLAQGTGLGGLVWIKGRSTTSDHALYDTVRGATFDLASNLTTGQTTQAQGVTAFLGSGFSIGTLAKLNTSAAIYSAWTFAEQPKFFDVVTYTGNGVAGRTVAHNLGSVPGCIIVKRTDITGGDWQVYHVSRGANQYLVLNSSAASATAVDRWNSTTPTASVFSLGTSANVNANGGTYVAYLFANNAGGFGVNGTDSAIACGNYNGNGSATGPVISLGWEPQLVIIKNGEGTSNWFLADNVRGATTGNDAFLYPNLTTTEEVYDALSFLATGFQITSASTFNTSANSYIYIAIRRGPMRTPTNGSSVFTPTVYTGTNVNNRLVNTSIAPDMVWIRQRNSTTVPGMVVGDRLRGQPYLFTDSTAVEATSATAFDQQLVSATEYGTAFSAMNGVYVGTDATASLNVNTTANNHIAEAFRRAPGFFDVVTYTGTGVTRTVNHNLGVVPEIIIVKSRSPNARPWPVAVAPSTTLLLDANNGNINSFAGYFDNTMGTSTTFSVRSDADVNASGNLYVAYLFASCPGVSKVGSYTGTGSTVQVDCGFTAGARFVLIKRTNAAGDWYVWDSARGIIAGNDPYLVLNSTAAEVTSTDWVDTLATGFEVSNAGSNLVNVNGASYIFLSVS